MNHLAIYSTKAYGEDYIEMMLNGKKTIDSKFTYRRTAPYGRLNKGDAIYLKESSGPVRGRVIVDNVFSGELRSSDDVMDYLAPHQKKLGIKDEKHLLEFWEKHAEKRYVCQWSMIKPERPDNPIRITKHDMRSWVVDFALPENVLLAFIDKS